MQISVHVRSPDLTDKLGRILANIYISQVSKDFLATDTRSCYPMYVLLTGGVGAGKSCIARGLIRQLTNAQNIPSPTYLISLSYDVNIKVKGLTDEKIIRKKLYHIDPYRLKKTQNLLELHSVESLLDSIVFVENADLTDLSDVLDERYVVKVSIRGARSLNEPSNIIFSEYDDHNKEDLVVSTDSLLSMGRTVTLETSDECVYKNEIMAISQDLDIKFDRIKSNDNDKETSVSCSDDQDHVYQINTNNKVDSIYESVNFYDNLMHDQDSIKSLQLRQLRVPKDLLILGVETSCDDTCLSVIDGEGTVLINYQLSQEEYHVQYRGVHPTVARACHRSNLEMYMPKIFDEVFERYKRYPDVIAFTSGPGLEVCLVEGVNKVYEYSQKYRIPIIPTHHLESHVMISRSPALKLDVEYPFVCCVASGGHTFICYVPREGVYRLMSTTIDDSIGETIDKVGRELGLPSIPAGRELEQLALTGNPNRYSMPKPYVKASPHNMSFSGFKHMGVKLATNISDTDGKGDDVRDLASSFQNSVMEYLAEHIIAVCSRLNNRCERYTCIVLAGGVASNGVLRDKMNDVSKKLKVPVKYPPPSLCTDNGVMVAWNGYEKIKNGYVLRPVTNYTSKTKVEVRTVWPLWSD